MGQFAGRRSRRPHPYCRTKPTRLAAQRAILSFKLNAPDRTLLSDQRIGIPQRLEDVCPVDGRIFGEQFVNAVAGANLTNDPTYGHVSAPNTGSAAHDSCLVADAIEHCHGHSSGLKLLFVTLPRSVRQVRAVQVCSRRSRGSREAVIARGLG
jgi:hypothetical protein